jgi:signal transduction histidine kinase
VLANNRLATIGEIAAGSAHEIRNPLTSIKGFLQMLSTQPPEGQAYGQDYIQLMLKEIDRINCLVGEFLLLSKPRQIHRQSVQPLQLLEEILPMIENEARLHNIELVIDRAKKSYPAVFVDSKLMKQVLLNLCKNAIEAMGEQGTLTLQLVLLTQRRQLQIRICDTGPGIPTAFFEQIFEPFFSTKEKGTGLGLPICKEIMNELGGEICLDSSSEKGTIFSVYIPLASSR